MPEQPSIPELQRRRLRVLGTVQGVGFRPFVFGLAHRWDLAGFVLNDGAGVVVEVEGPPLCLDRLEAALRDEAPSLAHVEQVASEPIAIVGETGFSIAASSSAGTSPDGHALIPADVATCTACLGEMRDPANRRHGYPFINCTQCGPRFTIVRDVPYDRPLTTMAEFPMCPECQSEYEDPFDRRFHAEPIACATCGPQLSMPVEQAAELLLAGAILAVKGLGGYHLCCDATDEGAVARLRSRKHREHKPFAIMTARPGLLAHVGEVEGELLHSPAAPIVLLRRLDAAELAASVAPGSDRVGIMLPYTPLHHLLLDAVDHRPLVMTSGNCSNEPIAFEDPEARARLSGIADHFVSHDRGIHRRCEDSVVRADQPLRRSRGHVPSRLALPVAAPTPLLAVGAQMKSTFCVARGDGAFMSGHLGDLDSEAAFVAFERDIELYLAMLGVGPRVLAHDLHPDYLSTGWAHRQADERDLELIGVQHHHAHAAACMAEHGLSEPVLALVFDGTGLGDDGTIWGGELLRCDLLAAERVGHLQPTALPGGEAAVREPWRVAAAMLEAAGRPTPFARWEAVRHTLAVNAPQSSGMGRLFDAVAAVLGVREEVSYEGQAAIELEQLAGTTPAPPYACRVENGIMLGSDLLLAAWDDVQSARPRAEIAAAFHEGVAAAATALVLQASPAGRERVVLSGGTFQNLRLLQSTRDRLTAAGYEVFTHRQVPSNDGGISFGQAAVAAARRSAEVR